MKRLCITFLIILISVAICGCSNVSTTGEDIVGWLNTDETKTIIVSPTSIPTPTPIPTPSKSVEEVNYDKAMELYIAGEWDAAEEAFLGLGDYEDAKEMALDCFCSRLGKQFLRNALPSGVSENNILIDDIVYDFTLKNPDAPYPYEIIVEVSYYTQNGHDIGRYRNNFGRNNPEKIGGYDSEAVLDKINRNDFGFIQRLLH